MYRSIYIGKSIFFKSSELFYNHFTNSEIECCRCRLFIESDEKGLCSLSGAYLEKAKGRTPGVKIKWSNEAPVATGRQARSDVITGRVGVRGAAKTAKEPRQAWELFFTHEMLEIIVKKTNARIESLRESCSKEIQNDSRYCHMGETSEQELLAFIGLMYIFGVIST